MVFYPCYFRFVVSTFRHRTNHLWMKHQRGWTRSKSLLYHQRKMDIIRNFAHTAKKFLFKEIWIPGPLYTVYPYFVLMLVITIMLLISPTHSASFFMGMLTGMMIPTFASGYAILNRFAYNVK